MLLSTDGQILIRVNVEEGDILQDSFVIPAGVTMVEDLAFLCTSFKKVTLPTSVIKIGDHAFAGCSNLQQIILSANITSIGRGAFINCSNLRQITLPASITSIGEEAFHGCMCPILIDSKDEAERERIIGLLPQKLHRQVVMHSKQEHEVLEITN
ncbi:leucine-rich repeat domain-containing protein [Legionella parisiensis]|uniref:Leucine-rich repeat domain-containing protein n=1 Tax=Legionella parisiensis TaxID=45071 RepID=A0A1E5JRM1_9GAMM|nr:leucine-rich repeat domain-containing protein [Legionella parisiensis]KTD45138.1 hypothetical protein Lpar_0009 [Legionella parisiensis]OEH47177.1 hypothetical protein lpari_01831 [Legionella parisiensis]STX76240.1 Uncharacterised protein [Legionella parisiensis]